MPRWCGSCRYVTDDLFANACPQCRTPLRLSPRVGRAARFLPAGRRPWLILGVLLAVAVPVGYFAFTAASGGGEPRRSSDDIVSGMTMNAVAWQLQPTPPTRRGERHLTRDFPADFERSGVLTWIGDGWRLKVRFDRGTVTSVDETPAPVGGRPTWDVRYDD